MAKTLLDFGIVVQSTVGQHTTQCPECSPTRKNKRAECLSVLVDPEGAIWNCHHCGWTGSLRDGVASRSDPSGWKTDEWKRPTLSGVGKWADRQREHFLTRGITEAVLERNRVCVERVWIPQVEAFEDAIAFPFYRAGELVNVKYRGRNKNFRMATGAERIFYGLDDITYQMDDGKIVAQDVAFIVEGEMDKLAFDVAGFSNCLSTPNGAPSKTAKNLGHYFDFIDASNYKLNEEDEEGLLDSIQTFVIAVDSDAPGQRLQSELVQRLGPDRCCVLKWPKWPLDREAITLWDRKTIVLPGDTLKDANEVLFCLGVEALQEAIRSAKPIRMDGVWNLDDYEADLDEYYEHGLPSGVALPWDAFRDEDGKSCLQAKEQMTWVVTGLSSHGKSRWVENVVVELAREEDWRTLYFSGEVNPKQLHASYLISQYSGLPFEVGPHERINPELYKQAKQWHKEHFWSLETDLLPFNVDQILEKATKMVRKHGIKCVVIDPWNNLYHEQEHFEREDQYIGKALQRINAWRARNNALVIIVAHPTKLRAINGKEPTPTLTDVKGGAEFRSMCDVGICVWRDIADENTNTFVHVQKVKFHHLGTFGVAQMKFDKPTSKFYDAGIPFNGVRTKLINAPDAPHFDRPPIDYQTDDGAPPWMQGDEYDV